MSVFSGRSVTPSYHRAVESWVQQLDLYTGTGFFYFPQFVLMFWPFHALPEVVGELAWRLLSVALLAWGLWKMLARHHQSAERDRVFLIATLVVMVPSLDAMRNGQANVIFAAFTLLAAAYFGDGAMGRKTVSAAGLFMAAAVVAKPIGIVMAGLALLASASMRWRLAALAALLGVLPYLLAPATYVTGQYQSMLLTLTADSTLSVHRFADFNGLLRSWGMDLDSHVSLFVRAVAGLLTAGFWFWAKARRDPADHGFILLGLTVCYLLLFNPMTEQNSVVIAAPWMTLFALRVGVREQHRALSWALIGLLLSMTILPELLRKPLPELGLWWHPLAMLAFLAAFIHWVISSPPATKLSIAH